MLRQLYRQPKRSQEYKNDLSVIMDLPVLRPTLAFDSMLYPYALHAY
jgi:hypothetical protein